MTFCDALLFAFKVKGITRKEFFEKYHKTLDISSTKFYSICAGDSIPDIKLGTEIFSLLIEDNMDSWMFFWDNNNLVANLIITSHIIRDIENGNINSKTDSSLFSGFDLKDYCLYQQKQILKLLNIDNPDNYIDTSISVREKYKDLLASISF